MPYTTLATSENPALIIYLLDISSSMASPLNQTSRMEVVNQALETTLMRMIMRSNIENIITPRYNIAMFAYGSEVLDLLNGFESISKIAELGVPQLIQLIPSGQTDTAKAFLHVESFLSAEIKHMKYSPAPFICHMTDGMYTGENPKPIVQRIMRMSVPDGNVLVENIFVSKDILKEPIENARNWKGITSTSELADKYAKELFSMSSLLPESYHNIMKEMGFNIAPNSRMLIPGISSELINIGFDMSALTPIGLSRFV